MLLIISVWCGSRDV